MQFDNFFQTGENVYTAKFMMSSNMEPNVMYVGFEGPTYFPEGSNEQEIMLQGIKGQVCNQS